MSIKKTTEKFRKEAILIHGNRYDYSLSDYVNNRIKLIIICSIHGQFEQIPFSHLQGAGCPKCVNSDRANKRRRTLEKYIYQAKLIHGDKYGYEKVIYINTGTKATHVCFKHGDFDQSPSAHLSGQGCPSCGIDKTKEYTKNSDQDFIQKALEIHGNKFDYSKVAYINNDTEVTIKCLKHGEFQQKPRHHISGQGCPKCKSSKGELTLIDIFEKNNIKYDYQYTLPFYNRLRYDFYLSEYNLLVEFHGKQHYEPIDYFGGEETFKYIRKNDIFKKALAKDYCIPIVYLNYKHLKKLNKKDFEKLVLSFLKR